MREVGRMLLRVLREGGGLALDATRVATTLREVEHARWVEGPATLVERLRARGLTNGARSPETRRRLFRVIHHMDRFMKGGPNCYRRSLTRIALDAESAREPFVLGLNRTDASARGHAWIEGKGEANEPFDVEFRL
jgi:hypothetical protein